MGEGGSKSASEEEIASSSTTSGSAPQSTSSLPPNPPPPSQSPSQPSLYSSPYYQYYNSFNIPPSPIFGAISVPLLWRAYQDYYYEIPRISQTLLQEHLAESAPDDLKRAAASDLAKRALKVASYMCLGGTCAVLGVVLFSYPSFDAAWMDLQQRGQRRWHYLQEQFRAGSRVVADRSHEDFQATRHMSEDQELDYISQKYFPGQDWTQPDGMAVDDAKEESKTSEDNNNNNKNGDSVGDNSSASAAAEKSGVKQEKSSSYWSQTR